MTYQYTIDINLPIDIVVKLWSDETNFHKWQDGFQSIELLEGKANTIDAKSKIILQQGKRSIELIETIICNDLPREKKALYEHVHMTNTQTTRFEKISKNKTKYTSKVTYTRFNGFMPKLLSKLFPNMFKKQSQKWMNQFKTFAENEY
ncbi:SRPBCC family protein [uncultured Psychroserpens sp.]|uniref:SRPBCC family protein n=1 Tax=uncultured Psychroserpens sp. TaxID=255436 RepID=UPI0026299EFC|nr:SRPBCC family protein [uncultured Psychroserpens sp.]